MSPEHNTWICLSSCLRMYSLLESAENIFITAHFLLVLRLSESATLQWESGPSLPMLIFRDSSVQYEDHFLVVGGSTNAPGTPSIDLIYRFDSDMTWKELGQTLHTPRQHFAALSMPEKYANCNWAVLYRNECQHVITVSRNMINMQW